MKHSELFYSYQKALMCLPSSVPELDADEWIKAYNAMKASLLADIKGDFHAGNLTNEEYDRLIKISDALKGE